MRQGDEYSAYFPVGVWHPLPFPCNATDELVASTSGTVCWTDVCQGGMYVLQLMDHYSAGFGVLIIAIVECVAVSWIYGIMTPSALPSVGPIANLKGPYFQPSLSVCVCVCVSDRHFYPLALTDFHETWSQGPYSDLVWPRP